MDGQEEKLTETQHVVGAGPFIGYCIFDNHEEVSSRKPR